MGMSAITSTPAGFPVKIEVISERGLNKII